MISLRTLYDSLAECCDAEFACMKRICTSSANKVVSNMYWPDKIHEKCVKYSAMANKDLTVDLFDSAQECCDDSIGFVYMCALLRVQVWMHKALTITMLIGLRGDALKTVMAQPLVEVSQRGGIRCTHHQPSVARIYGRTQQIVL